MFKVCAFLEGRGYQNIVGGVNVYLSLRCVAPQKLSTFFIETGSLTEARTYSVG